MFCRQPVGCLEGSHSALFRHMTGDNGYCQREGLPAFPPAPTRDTTRLHDGCSGVMALCEGPATFLGRLKTTVVSGISFTVDQVRALPGREGGKTEAKKLQLHIVCRPPLVSVCVCVCWNCRSTVLVLS